MKTDIQSDNDSKGKDGSDRDDKDRGRDRERTRRGDRPSRFSSGGRDRSPVRDRKRGGDRRVYVSNVAYESRWQDVKDLFRAEVGEVTFVEMFVDENDKPRGCGIVEFETPELAAKAVEKMHRFDLKGRKLVVKEDFDVERDKYGRPVPSRNRGGGDREANNSSLNSRRDDGPPRNNSWDNPNSQLSALASLTTAAAPPATNNPSKWGNLYGLSPQFLESLWINGPLVNKVFVANLDYKVDEKKLREVFKLAGKVVHAEISMDKEGKSRGFGVVEYEHPVEAVQAISMLHNQTLFDRRLTVRMDRNNDKPEGPPKLPEGLKGLGMGLGTNGAPLTDVARNLPMIQQSPLMGLASNVQSSLAAAACAAQLANLTGSGPLGTGLGSVGGLLGQSLNVTEHLASLGANQAFAAPTLNSSQPLSSGLSSGLNPGISTNLNSGLSSGLNSGLNSSLSSGLNSNLSSGLSSGLNSSINSNMNSGLGSSLGHGMGGTAGLGNSPFSNSLSSNSAFMGGSGGNNSGYGNAASANVGSYGSTGRDFDSMSAALSGANAGFNNLDRDNYRGNNNNMGGMGNMGGNFGNGPSRPMGNIGNNIGMQNTSGNRVSDTIVIKNLPPNTTWTQLRDKFRDVGDVKFAEMRGKDGIVRFNSEWDAERAVREMDRTRYEGRTIDVLYYY